MNKSMTKELVNKWFKCWETGKPEEIPVTEDFQHQSPFGLIEGKKQYLDIVNSNREKFLDHKFRIIDEIYFKDRAAVRYESVQDDHKMEVSEWYYIKDGQISKIIAYYHIGEIREDRKLKVQ